MLPPTPKHLYPTASKQTPVHLGILEVHESLRGCFAAPVRQQRNTTDASEGVETCREENGQQCCDELMNLHQKSNQRG